jgi:hypothetical protein
MAAAVVVVAGLGAVSAVALSNSGATTFLGGSGTATFTWQSVQSNGAPGGAPTPFSGTIAGVPVQGQSSTPLSQGGGPTGGGPTLPTQFTLFRWTGTYGGKSFDLAVSPDLRSSLAGSPTGFNVKVDGTYGSQPVHLTASLALTQANALHFDGTIGPHHVTGTVWPKGNGANTAVATFVVTG